MHKVAYFIEKGAPKVAWQIEKGARTKLPTWLKRARPKLPDRLKRAHAQNEQARGVRHKLCIRNIPDSY